MKIDEVRGRLEFEEVKLNNNLVSEDKKQEKMHEYLHKSIAHIHIGTETINGKGMSLNRRIEEIERMIGVRACVDDVTGKMIY